MCQVADVVAHACGASALDTKARLCTFKASPGYMGRPWLKNQTKAKNEGLGFNNVNTLCGPQIYFHCFSNKIPCFSKWV